jgi:hypothetical protein
MSLSSLLTSPKRGAVAHILGGSLVLSFFHTSPLVVDRFFFPCLFIFRVLCLLFHTDVQVIVSSKGPLVALGVAPILPPTKPTPFSHPLRACRRRRRTVRGIKNLLSVFPKGHGNPDEARESADADGTRSQCPGRTDAQFHHVPLDIGAFPATPSQRPKSQTLTHTSFLRCSSGQ